MKKGICIGSVPGSVLVEQFQRAAACGFQAVEIMPLDGDAKRQEVRALAETHGLAVSSVMNADHWQHPLSDPDPAVRQRGLEGIRTSIETAAAVGADTVLVVPATVTPDVTYEEAWDRSTEALAEVLPLAEERKVALAIENVWNKFLLSPRDFVEYVDRFDSEFLGAYFDVGNIVLFGYPDHWIRSLGERIRKVHLKGFDAGRSAFTWLLEGTIDWERVVGALREVGYDDCLTAELPQDEKDPVGRLQRIGADMDYILSLGRRKKS
ncbi:MAG TPA: sugar phosphate isomerase/epimerase family protein [Sumerlaeia bacterium]|nr:sugar phosphate isomerase/epimerase family protein [Sumerlaeia bacterium]